MTFRSTISAFAIASAIGMGALAMPAQAAGYTGLDVYTSAEPSRFAPDGIGAAAPAAEEYRSHISFRGYRAANENAVFDNKATERGQLYNRIDREERQW